MDDEKRSFLSLGLVALSLAGLYYAFAGDAPASEAGDPSMAVSEAVSPARDDVDDAARLLAAETFTVETDDAIATFTSLTTAMTSFELKGDRYVEDGKPINLVTTDKPSFLPLRMELRGVTLPEDAVFTGEQLSPTAVRFQWEGDGVRVTRKIEAGERFQLWSTVKVDNLSNEARTVGVTITTHHYISREKEEDGGGFGRPSPSLSQGLCMHGEDHDLMREDRENLRDEPETLAAVHFTGIENVYFANLLAPSDGAQAHCEVTASDRGGVIGDEDSVLGSLFESRLVYADAEVSANDSHITRTMAYVGPKDFDALEAAGHGLPKSVDLGWFSWIATGLIWLLRTMYGFVGNWGFAIILMTICVKALLYPLTEKSFQSMAKMRLLKPQMDEINERFKDDREQKGAAIMELYKREKVSPFGGCLPSLLQMPIWFALYQSLSTNIELYHTPFIAWWTDLSAPDPLFVLPIALGGLMFLQQKLNPPAMDPMQAKMMMYGMPIMMSVFMLFLPAGLCLYMVTNSALSITQQKWIHWRLENAVGDAANTPADDDPTDAAPETMTKELSASSRRVKPKTKRKRRRGRA